MSVQSGAIFDHSSTYRYLLWRSWSQSPKVGFVMLNPSQADATLNDPTIRRCIGFAQSWGYGGLEVVNLFAYRTKSPAHLQQIKDPIGADNDRYLLTLAKRVDTIVLAWGNAGTLKGRDRAVMQQLNSQQNVFCLGITKTGQPRHPLYLKRDTLLTKLNFTDAETSVNLTLLCS